jgi:hypothetical protein
MITSNQRQNRNAKDIIAKFKPGMIFVVIILGALIAFEVFNYTTTEHALRDLLGNLTFMGLAWATILALAFCGIDFAGIARLFTPEQGMNEPKEVWYLFGAWLLAATMNAILTWWGVSMAISSHAVESQSVVDPATITRIVPVFVAVMVWVIRILIIGTLSLTLDRMMHPGAEQRVPLQSIVGQQSHTHQQQTSRMNIPQTLAPSPITSRPTPVNPRGVQAQPNTRYDTHFTNASTEKKAINDPLSQARPEPTYHSLNASPRPNGNAVSEPTNRNSTRY